MTEEFSNIDRIIVRYLLNEASEGEKELLLTWLKEDSNHRHHFFTFRDIWEQSRKNASEHSGTAESFRLIQERMTKESDPITRKPVFIRILKYAAAILMIAVLGIALSVLFRTTPKTDKQVIYTQIVTENGQKKEITLPDGTRIWLNSGTTLKYGDDYGKDNRQVILLGEAFFDVIRDETKVFIVNAGDVKIKVLGTSFNVNCYPENEIVETTVISGTVSIENNNIEDNTDIVVLNKSEKGTYLKAEQKIFIERKTDNNPVRPLAIKKIALTDDDLGYIATWKDQTLSFNNETFEEMALKLHRWFNVEISIQDDELKDYRYKGKFENVRSIFQVLEVVKLTTPIAYEYNEKTKEISIKKLTD